MVEKQSKGRPSFTNVLLAAGIFLGLVLCYFIALPFLPALVWSFTLAVLFVPLDARIRKRLGSPGLSAGATTAIVAVIVVVPAILVIGTLLNETVKSAPLLTAMANSATWTRVTADHPWLVPVTSWLNARLNIQELIQAATSWLAGWSGSFVKGSIAGLVSLLLTFYFLFYLLRDRSSAVATVANMLPLSASEFALLGDRIVNTIIASVYGTAIVATLQGGLGGLMFWWLDLPAPLFWGVVMGLLAVVPFLGAFVIWAPTAIVLALSAEFVAAIQLTVWGLSWSDLSTMFSIPFWWASGSCCTPYRHSLRSPADWCCSAPMASCLARSSWRAARPCWKSGGKGQSPADCARCHCERQQDLL